MFLQPNKYVVVLNLDESTLRLIPNNAFTAVVHTFGSVLASIDTSPIAIIAFIADSVFEKSQRVTSVLINHVVVQVYKLVNKLVGSANFLGSLVRQVSNVGNGVKALFYEQFKCLRFSPTAFSYGPYVGSATFVQSTISGVLNSASKTSSRSRTALRIRR